LKKILFINPKTIDLTVGIFSSNMVRMSKKKRLSMPNLAPMIFAALTPPSYEFTFIDDDYKDVDLNMNADLVAISAMTMQVNRAYEIADHFRKKGVTVVIGGIHASVLPDETSQHCDATMIGQGENTWLEMLKDFEQGTLKKFYDTKDYPNIDYLISPKVDIINFDHYLMFPIQATRGCPHDCDFCSIKHTAGHVYRMKPVSQVIAEIKEYEKYNKRSVGGYKKHYFFVDENIYVNRKYVKELLSAMIELKISWMAQGTVDAAYDEEMLELMARSGCRQYAIGLESISDETLAEANKPKINKTQSYGVAIKNLLRHGIIPAGYLIYGFDNDDHNVFKRTVDFAINNHLIQPYFSTLTPYPGTRLYNRMKAENRIFDKNWDHYNSLTPVHHPRQFSPVLLEEGIVWSSKQIANFDVVKKQFDYFWSHGPWPQLKTLTFKERLLLVLMAIKLRKHNKKYCDFLLWAARNKKTCDFGSIFAALFLHEAVMQSDKGEAFEELILEAEKNSVNDKPS